MKTILCLVATLMLTCFMGSALAQEVSIPDPGLNAAIREALQKPVGPLTQQDMLSLNFLSACCRSISSIQGLEAARNLTILDLHANSLTSCVIPNSLTNLQVIDLFQNQLSSVAIPTALSNLTIVDVAFNSLTQCTLHNGLKNLDTLFLEGNQLTNFALPTGLSQLTQLDLSANELTTLNVPADMTNVVTLLVFANQLTNLTLSANLNQLANLDLDFNHLPSFTLPAGLTNLVRLTLFRNQLTNLALTADATNLSFLDAGDNQLTSLVLPAGLRNLSFLRLFGNKLTSFALPPGLANLTAVFLRSNQLTNLTLAEGLTSLVQIDVLSNQLTSLSLPPDMTRLITLVLDENPLTALVLSEPLAATNLAGTVSTLRNRGIPVFTYPLVARLVEPLALPGSFKFGIIGPPGIYSVLASKNLETWSAVGVASNQLGSVIFHDATTNVLPHKFYHARLLTSPTNMVFIPPNTFTMGSPTNEQGRNIFEGPQSRVTLTRGFWIGDHEVTQGEYVEVTGTNPSNFPGDLRRPISSVNLFDATNYCWKLTQQELAAGRIPRGSHYRLPTEAEWECAARAGTTTRFSYGDDDENYTSLTNYAWFVDLGHIDLNVHPVGQKLPNPWGIYDMHGHVWEWCQDWYGDQLGGAQTNPQGPDSNAQGLKVIRGGAYDYPSNDCRSASRFFRFTNWPDSDVGFRVVLVTEYQ